jgi:alkanesulfonate monooxygenase SsuD/methylene tetrahydromethanopterin reductase-like flavin-dependent oxidoreductase (luciferase family)
MLRITLPHVDAWNAWFKDTENSPAGVPPLRELVDGICREVGRDPGAVERTVAVQVRLTGGQGRIQGDVAQPPFEPLSGTPEVMAEELRAYAREGIAEVQLVLDPISLASIDEFASVLELLDRPV